MSNQRPFGLPLRKQARPGVLLDTNVWRYVLDNNAAGFLLHVARKGAYEIQIAPAVVYETLRLQDTSLRRSLITLMTNQRFQRLMPEAYSESMEILREIERKQSDWLRLEPNLTFFKRLKNDWHRTTGGFWVRCARSPERESKYIESVGAHIVAGARIQAEYARREMRDSSWKRLPPLDRMRARFPGPVPGWRGDDVEMWRLDSLTTITWGLMQHHHAYVDWIAPFIDFDGGLLRSAEWVEFWLYKADHHNLPRQWMRWAYDFAQRFRKVSAGTPGDSQLATYFLETDVVVSADKVLLAILEECRPFAPAKLPVGYLIPGSGDSVPQLLRFLNG